MYNPFYNNRTDGNALTINLKDKSLGLLFDYAVLYRLWLIQDFLGHEIYGKTVADIGCGRGYISFLLWSLGAEIISLDISLDALRETKSLSKHNKKFTPDLCCCDTMVLPFRDETFDVICCFEVLEHLPNDKRAVKEIIRVTKCGGIITFSLPFRASATNSKRTYGRYKQYSWSALKDLFSPNDNLCLERVIFWRFPIMEFLDIINARKIFAALGGLIKSLSSINDINSGKNFLELLEFFYCTSLWRKALLPLILNLSKMNKLFYKRPYSKNVFIILRRVR
jgi:2-polyprenyl-3-methyl-5-hydroxy-6-metoxy-1,4-benzoquinol methylase